MAAEWHIEGKHEHAPPSMNCRENLRYSPSFALSSMILKIIAEIPKNFRKSTLTKLRVSMILKATSQYSESACWGRPAFASSLCFYIDCPQSPKHMSPRLWEREQCFSTSALSWEPSLQLSAWSPQQAGQPLVVNSMVLFFQIIIRFFHLTMLGPFITPKPGYRASLKVQDPGGTHCYLPL